MLSACCCCFIVVFALIPLVCHWCFAFCVSGGGSRHSNPSRDTGSKRLRNPQDEAPEGSNAPKRNVKTTASKQKEPTKGMDEISVSEYVEAGRAIPM